MGFSSLHSSVWRGGRSGRQRAGSTARAQWSELKAAGAVAGSVWCAARCWSSFSAVLFKLCPGLKRGCWSELKITPAQARETHQKMTSGSVTFSVTVNSCILPSCLRSWQLQLCKPLPCRVLVSLFGFNIVHFPCLKLVFFCLESEMVSPLCYAIGCIALNSRR